MPAPWPARASSRGRLPPSPSSRLPASSSHRARRPCARSGSWPCSASPYRSGYFPTRLLQEKPGWNEAFAGTITDLEAAELSPERLEAEGDPRLADVATIWRALNRLAGASWTIRKDLPRGGEHPGAPTGALAVLRPSARHSDRPREPGRGALPALDPRRDARPARRQALSEHHLDRSKRPSAARPGRRSRQRRRGPAPPSATCWPPTSSSRPACWATRHGPGATGPTTPCGSSSTRGSRPRSRPRPTGWPSRSPTASRSRTIAVLLPSPGPPRGARRRAPRRACAGTRARCRSTSPAASR